jgi:putative component of toxin-antitoxin plasmid stabilization module
MVSMEIKRTPEFKIWFDQQTEKAKAQIDARLKNIELFNYFGDQ